MEYQDGKGDIEKHMEKELVSIVIPVYKTEKYVEFTIKDICRQTYKNIQIILVDDGSPDSAGEICDSFARRDPRIEVVHTDNRGLSAARNLGVDLSRGEYIYFLDSDDRVHPEIIERLYFSAQKWNCDIVQAGTFAFVDDAILPRRLNNSTYHVYSNIVMCENMLRGTVAGATVIQNKLYSARLFDKSMRFPEGRIHEDVALSYKLFWKAEKIAVLDAELFYYRSLRQGSIMHSPYTIARLDGLTAAEERFQFFKNLGQEKLYALALLSWCDMANNTIKSLKKSEIQNKIYYIKNIRKDLLGYYKILCKYPKVKLKSKIRVGVNMLWGMLIGT